MSKLKKPSQMVTVSKQAFQARIHDAVIRVTSGDESSAQNAMMALYNNLEDVRLEVKRETQSLERSAFLVKLSDLRKTVQQGGSTDEILSHLSSIQSIYHNYQKTGDVDK